MATPWQKQIKSAVQNDTNVLPDEVTCRQDGTVEVRRSYYYRHGMTAEQWGKVVQKAVEPTCGRVVETRDEYRHWPGTSYFVAIVVNDDHSGDPRWA